MKQINFVILILIIFNIFFNDVVNSQGQGECIFNGTDYSSISNLLFSSASNDGKYKYNWRICNYSSECDPYGNNYKIAACQFDTYENNKLFPVGYLNNGVFKIVDRNVMLSYSDSYETCGYGIYRSINILLKCGVGDIETSWVTETSLCQYYVSMTGQLLCPPSTPVTLPPTTPPPTTPPPTTPTPTTPPPTTTPSIEPDDTPLTLCQSSDGQLLVKSDRPIFCRGSDTFSCHSLNGSTCTSDNSGMVQCLVPGSTIACKGSLAQCLTNNYICSINNNTYNVLQVNNIFIYSNYFNSSFKFEDYSSKSSTSSSHSFNLYHMIFIFIFSLIIIVIF